MNYDRLSITRRRVVEAVSVFNLAWARRDTATAPAERYSTQFDFDVAEHKMLSAFHDLQIALHEAFVEQREKAPQ